MVWFVFCPQILTFPKCLKRREITDTWSVLLPPLLKQNSAFSLCCSCWVLFMSNVWFILRTMGNCLACSFRFLPACFGAPQAQGTVVRPGHLPDPADAVGGWRIEGAGTISFTWEFLPWCHMLCLSLSIFLLVACVAGPLGKIRGTERQRKHAAL